MRKITASKRMGAWRGETEKARIVGEGRMVRKFLWFWKQGLGSLAELVLSASAGGSKGKVTRFHLSSPVGQTRANKHGSIAAFPRRDWTGGALLSSSLGRWAASSSSVRL